MGGLWAIILAAGESKRMGFQKMLLLFNSKTMIENVIMNVTGSAVDNTLVVLGPGKDDLIELIKKFDVSYCINDDYKDGMLSSVKCGFKSVPSDFEAILVFQGDQPLIPPSVVNMMIEAYRSTGKGIVIPVYDKKRGHPLLIDCRYKDEINTLDSNEGLRSLSYKYSGDVLEVETDIPGILRDFDTYEEYKKEINQKQ